MWEWIGAGRHRCALCQKGLSWGNKFPTCGQCYRLWRWAAWDAEHWAWPAQPLNYGPTPEGRSDPKQDDLAPLVSKKKFSRRYKKRNQEQ